MQYTWTKKKGALLAAFVFQLKKTQVKNCCQINSSCQSYQLLLCSSQLCILDASFRDWRLCANMRFRPSLSFFAPCNSLLFILFKQLFLNFINYTLVTLHRCTNPQAYSHRISTMLELNSVRYYEQWINATNALRASTRNSTQSCTTNVKHKIKQAIAVHTLIYTYRLQHGAWVQMRRENSKYTINTPTTMTTTRLMVVCSNKLLP